MNKPSKEFEAKVNANIWETNFDEVIAFIKSAAIEDPYEEDGMTLKPGAIDWSWIKNSLCKYIKLSIDMRDGGFILMDRDGNRISLDQLKYQYSHIEEGEDEEKQT